MHLITETFAQTFCYFIFINSKYFYIKKYFLNFKKYVLSIEEKHLKSHSEQWNVLQTYQSCCCQFRIPHFYCQSVLRKVWKSEGRPFEGNNFASISTKVDPHSWFRRPWLFYSMSPSCKVCSFLVFLKTLSSIARTSSLFNRS